MSRELKEATCRSCRAQLGLEDTGDANQRLAALFVLSVTLGLRPGELRTLTWDLVDFSRGVVHVWRSASKSGDTKTPQSKRSLILPKRAVTALKAHKAMQDRERREAGKAWHDLSLVFCHEDGSMYTSDALNWRFGKMTRKAGIGHWHAHEGRHTVVPIQEISDTVGRKSTPCHRDRLPPRDRARDPRGSDRDGRRLRRRRRRKRLKIINCGGYGLC